MNRLGLAVTLTLAACGGAAEDPTQPQQPPPPEGNNNNNNNQQQKAFDLSGPWAMKVVNGQIVDSFLGREATTITTLSFVRVNAALELEETLCSLENTPYKGTTTTYPAATISAFEGASPKVTLDEDQFKVAESAGTLGWRPRADVMTEILPTEDDDPRVFDADGDGHPGATVSVVSPFASGDVYVVTRVVRSLSGRTIGDDRIEGQSDTVSDQEVIGASNELLTAGSVTTEADPNPANNVFVMVRIDEAAANCPAIIAAADTLF